MGHLLRVGNSYLSDFIESAIADSFRILESSKDEYKRILALLILKEVADNSPTHFYQHIQAFRSMILSPLKDSHIRIREAAATALSACLLVMQQRENQKKNDFYFDFLESIEELPKDNRNESIHGYLLAINSFLNNSLEFCDSRIEAIYTKIKTYFNTKESYIKLTIIRTSPRPLSPAGLIPVIARFMNTYAHSFLTQDFKNDVYSFLSPPIAASTSLLSAEGHVPRRGAEGHRGAGAGGPRRRVQSSGHHLRRDQGVAEQLQVGDGGGGDVGGPITQ